jgi:hypothetical protein
MNRNNRQDKASSSGSSKVHDFDVSISKHASGAVQQLSKRRAEEVEQMGREAMRRYHEKQKALVPA